MIEVLEGSTGKSVALRVSGKVTREDYIGIIPQLERTIEVWNGINLMILFDQVEGLALGAVWEDAQFNLKYFRDIHRAALVGNQEWLGWLTKLAQLFVHDEARHFLPEQVDAAWDWVKAGEEQIDSVESVKE